MKFKDCEICVNLGKIKICNECGSGELFEEQIHDVSERLHKYEDDDFEDEFDD